MKFKLQKTIYLLSRYLLYGFSLQLVFFNLVLALNVSAQFQSIEEVKVRVTKNEMTLGEFLQKIESETTFTFSFDRADVNEDISLVLSKGNASIESFLKEIAAQTTLGFRQVNDQIDIRLTKKSEALLVAVVERTIKGVVKDDQGQPLPGATISVQGTTTGTISDLDGSYSITVPDGAVLVFSYIGYESQIINIGNQSIINVTMSMDESSLEEVVVVGYGTQKRSDLTGAVSSVKSEELTAYPAIDAVQALQGRAAGVQIQSNNGAPGASMKVRVRGGTSINASSDPIFVVDGFIGAAMPPPEDIASIEVLKDASATAIYGSRGANGVIMVTTKRGKTGAARIEFNTSYSMQNEINRLDLLNAAQFNDYISDARPNIQPAGGDTDWQDQIFRTGGIQNYQLSISGGTDNVNYYVSGAYFDQKGVIINSDFNRFSITSNLDIQASEKLKIGLNLFARRSSSDGVRTQENSGGLTPGVVASAFKFEPDQPIYNADGSFTVARLNDPHDNPYAVATQLVNENVNDRFQGNFFAEYDIIEGLKFKTTFGATANTSRTGTFAPTSVTEGRNVGGDASINAFRNTLVLNENYLTYSKTFGIDHTVSAMGGYSFQSSESESFGARGTSFITDAFSFWNLGSSAVWQAPNSALTDWQISSYYGRLNYSFGDKYLITFNARYDGSSTFSKNNKWAFFPSGAIAWNMKNEKFLETSDLISFWKWRGSYGITGNQAISPYQTLARFSPVFTIIDGVPVNAVRPTTVANDNLTWETTAQLNIGTDVGFWDDRVTFSAEYYRMVTSDLLFAVQLPQYSGYTNQLRNIGEVENKGVELTLGSRNLVGAFQWDMDINFSRNRNKVLSLPEGTEIQYGSGPGHMVGLGNTQLLKEGYPVGSFYGWVYDGVYQEGDEFLPGGGFEQVPGGEKFRDLNNDGSLNSDDREIIGNPHPDFFWGWNHAFRYKNFDLNVFFQGSFGNDILSYTLMELNLMSGINNATTAALDRWTPTNTQTDIPMAFNGRTRRVSSRWIYDGTFTRLKNLSLGYNFPKTVVNKLKLSKLRLYVSAQNILTFTDYEGYDPEVNYRSDGATDGNRNLGLDYGSYPNAKSYTVGLNVGF
ncbi:SusC/RagA family TonB-linked outer membrane protein [Cyclobacterium amurskyense]|uniref:TonB family protein n=1 Tax=Cyclobacterium amurskyense TaxID=320787 RepID=A0A0H4Q0R1_9BACT|nr:TonB-dependent receptor [Cyclobacterium amurskyense]AKP54242.1 TonB family protein [Cyclobacterium amurskyense]